MTSDSKGRSWLKTIIRIGLVALLIYLLWGFFAVIDWGAVVDGIANLSTRAWIGLIAISVLRILAEAWVLAAVTPGLMYGHAIAAFLAPSAAASVVPGLPADLVARFGMYNSWGFSNEDTTISVTASFVFTTGAKISLPIFAAVGLAVVGRTGSAVPELETVALIAAALLIGGAMALTLVLRSDQLAHTIGSRIGRAAHRLAKPFRIHLERDLAEELADRFVHFQATAGELIKRRWLPATVAALLAQFLQYGILLVALRGVGVTSDQLNPVEIFAAFALVQLITAIPITPGGLGIAEAAYITFLVAESDSTLVEAVTAGTLIYRLFSWVLIIPLGGLAWLWWSRSLPKQEATQNNAP